MDRLARWSQLLERARQLVPVEHSFNWRSDAGAPHELTRLHATTSLTRPAAGEILYWIDCCFAAGVEQRAARSRHSIKWNPTHPFGKLCAAQRHRSTPASSAAS